MGPVGTCRSYCCIINRESLLPLIPNLPNRLSFRGHIADIISITWALVVTRAFLLRKFFSGTVPYTCSGHPFLRRVSERRWDRLPCLFVPPFSDYKSGYLFVCDDNTRGILRANGLGFAEAIRVLPCDLLARVLCLSQNFWDFSTGHGRSERVSVSSARMDLGKDSIF
jgi:hypothetical protein